MPADGSWTHRMPGAPTKCSPSPCYVQRIGPHQRLRVGDIHDRAAPGANGISDIGRRRARRNAGSRAAVGLRNVRLVG